MKNTKHIVRSVFVAIIAMFVAITGAHTAHAVESPNVLLGPNLHQGSQGPGVVVLQGLLSELGYLNVPPGVPFGYFGPLTRNAVAQYQRERNVSPAVGYFGPLTKQTMGQHFSSRNWLALLGW